MLYERADPAGEPATPFFISFDFLWSRRLTTKLRQRGNPPKCFEPYLDGSHQAECSANNCSEERYTTDSIGDILQCL